MGIGSKLIAGEFKSTGGNEINSDKVAKLWDSRFSLTKYGEDFTLIVYRKGFKSKLFKSRITRESAKEVIAALDLVEVPDRIFIRASTFVRRGL